MCSCVGVFLMVEYDDNQDATVLVCVYLCVCVLVDQYGDNLKAKALMSVYLCVYL